MFTKCKRKYVYIMSKLKFCFKSSIFVNSCLLSNIFCTLNFWTILFLSYYLFLFYWRLIKLTPFICLLVEFCSCILLMLFSFSCRKCFVTQHRNMYVYESVCKYKFVQCFLLLLLVSSVGYKYTSNKLHFYYSLLFLLILFSTSL